MRAIRFQPVGEFSIQNRAISLCVAVRAVHPAQPNAFTSLKSEVYSGVCTAAALDAAPYGAAGRNCDALMITNGVTVLPQFDASAKPPVPKKSKPGVLKGKVKR